MRMQPQRHIGTHRHFVRKMPGAVLHAPQFGEEIGLFSDRIEDAVEYDVIMHDFASLHDREVAADESS